MMSNKEMNKINLIWIASNSPYDGAPAAGGQTFNYYLKSFSHDERFDVRLICWGDINKQEAIEKENAHIVHHVIYTNPSILTKIKKIGNLESNYNPWNKNANLISNYCASEILKYLFKYKEEGYSPDIIILEWTNTVVMAHDVHRLFPNAHLVASEHDVTFIGYKRKADYYNTGFNGKIWKIKYKNEKKRELDALSLCERVYVHNADNTHTLMKEGIKRERIRSLTPFFHNMSTLKRTSEKKDILFFGAMSRPENYLSAEWFITKVLPLIDDIDIRFVIVGGNPPELLTRYQNDKVVVTGFVENIEPFFEKSMCLAAPLVLGAGIKVKILEALSSGIPVLTNEIGIEGIPARDKIEYYKCNTPEEYACIIRQLFEGRIDETALERSSKSFITKEFSIEGSVRKYKEDIIELVKTGE